MIKKHSVSKALRSETMRGVLGRRVRAKRGERVKGESIITFALYPVDGDSQAAGGHLAADQMTAAFTAALATEAMQKRIFRLSERTAGECFTWTTRPGAEGALIELEVRLRGDILRSVALVNSALTKMVGGVWRDGLGGGDVLVSTEAHFPDALPEIQVQRTGPVRYDGGYSVEA